jgi:H+-transporting ATPase
MAQVEEVGSETEAGFAKVPLDDLWNQLKTSPSGLSDEDAKRRLEEHGPNELSEKATNPVLQFLSYFWGPIPWMIEAAAILSAVVQHWADFGIITALLVVNAVIGFWEEHQAGNTIASLKRQLALKARVLRDGSWRTIPSRELVPGDVVHLVSGFIVPADIRLTEGNSLQVDQSALTGESLPVTDEVGDSVYSGSIVRQGEATGIVYGTGANTYMGRTAHLVASAHTVSHFQKAVMKIGDYLIVLALALVLLILAVALFRGDRMLTTLEFALILTVAAIPVALPTVLSVTLAVGARLLARKKAIVSHLTSIEELAGIDVLCSDKTGTLTQNKLTLGDSVAISAQDTLEVILAGALATRPESDDPIDLAVRDGVEDSTRLSGYELLHFQPFDPVHKRTEATLKAPEGGELTVSKGAVQVILDLLDDSTGIRERVEEATDDFARRGFRSLGVARKEGDGPWKYVGILSLFDPPREDSRETIKTAQDLGVEVKMVTGDQVAIARETARRLDLGTGFLSDDFFQDDPRNQTEQQAERIEKADGFAQVFPEHKFNIVSALQKLGHIVGMTGDGVNDAPALKKADVGVAVSGATDAARSAADIVLLAPGLSVIVDAIRESRKIFQRMTSYATYRIAETIRVLLFMTLSILVFNFYPVTAVMIVLLALLNDGAILSIAYDRVRASDRPDSWHMPSVLGVATVLGVTGVIASFGLFYIGEQVLHLSREVIQTLIYLKLSVAGHLTIFITRTEGPFWSHRPSRVVIGAVVGTQIVATLIAAFGILMTPIGWTLALMVWGYALVWFLIGDMVKLLARRVFNRTGHAVLPGLRRHPSSSKGGAHA